MGVKMEGKYYGPVGLVVEGNIYDSGREILTPEEAEEYIRRLQSRMHELYWDFFINLPGLCFLLSFLLFLATSFNYWILDELGINGLLRLLVFAPVLVSALCFCWRNQPVAAELEWAAAQKKMWREALWRNRCSSHEEAAS